MYEVTLPAQGKGVTEGEILEWRVAPGDRVAEHDVLLEVETEKAVIEVPSPVVGTVHERHADVGDVVDTGAVVVTIDTDDPAGAERDEGEGGAGEDAGGGQGAETGTDGTTDAQRETDGQRIFAPPSVRRLARELGVQIGDVSGSGPGGRVTEDDVRAAAAEGEGASGTDDETTSPEPKSAVRRVGGGDGADEPATAPDADDESVEPDEENAEAATRDGEDDEPTTPDEENDQPTTPDEKGDEPATPADDAEPVPPSSAEPLVRAAVKPTERTADRDRTLATPATRRLARELDVDVDAVPTDVTREGEPFVDEAAVRADAERRAASAEGTADGDVYGSGERDAAGTTGTGEEGAAATGEREVPVARTEPYSGDRRRRGERRSRAHRAVPQATHHDRVDVGELVAARERLEPLAADRGVSLTFTPFVLKCVAAALRDHPVLNTHLDADAGEIRYLAEYHLGVATDTDHGERVPVVRDVDERGIVELAAATNDLVSRARDGSIDSAALSGATFTVVDVGAIGGEYAEPIVRVPQTAVLAVGALRDRPVARDGDVVARPTLPLSLAYDTRVIDAADAARFTNALKTSLADPTRLLLE